MIFTKINKIYALLVAAAVAVAAVAAVWMAGSLKKTSIAVGADDAIGDTPVRIESMRAIGQWEFVAIADEEMVDTVRKGIFTDDKLARIYYGTLRLGIDMQRLADDAFMRQGDSLIVRLPAVQLLDEDFVDETRTKSFFESGKWTPADRENLMQRAARMMRIRCITPENIKLAENNAVMQMSELMRQLGHDKVKIVFSYH